MLVGNGSALQLKRTTALGDSDVTTYQTGGIMASLVAKGARSARVRGYAQQALFGLPASATRQQKADAVWSWVHSNIRLVAHEELACRYAGRCDGEAQFLIDPESALTVREGDCAIFTPVVCAMLFSVGVPCRMIAIAADSKDPSRYSHVYAAAVLEDGSLYPLDASHGPRPGWESDNAYRSTVWSVFGLPLW